MVQLFVPGWGAPAALYEAPADWVVLSPPPFAAASTLEARLGWLRRELDCSDGRVVLGGHSMGAALAVLAAAEQPQKVERLVLLSPAGLPLAKPVHESLRDFVRQLRSRLYPRDQAVRAVGAVLAAPRAAWQLAFAVRMLDLLAETPQRTLIEQHDLPPHRAHTLAAGATIFAALQERLRTPLKVSRTGIREGALALLAERREAA